jgi:hypothetical protein
MRILTGLMALALGTPLAVRAQAMTGTFLASRIDASPLPLTDRVTDTDGTTYLVEFDRMVLSLRAGNRFRASVRFRRTLHSRDPRGRDRATPIQSMTVNGSYAIVNGEVRFTPDPSKETSGLRMLSARLDGTRRLSMPFHYRNGTAERQRTLLLVRQDDVL